MPTTITKRSAKDFSSVLLVAFIAGVVSACGSGVSATTKPKIVTEPPVANPDVLSADRSAAVTTGNVLANDTSSTGPLHVIEWTNGTKGNVVYNGNGVFAYEPNAQIDSGTDTFSYTVADSNGATSTTSVNVEIPAGWGKPVVASTHYQNYQKLTSTDGDITLIWTEFDGARHNLWAKRYLASGKTWQEAQRIEQNDFDAGQMLPFSALIDTNGNITVVWTQFFDATPNRSDLWANRFDKTAGTWGTAQKIETEDLGSPYSPILTADGVGNVTVAWQQYDSPTHSSIWANRMGPDGAWAPAIKLTASAALSDANPAVTVDNNGNVIVRWMRYNTATSVTELWASRYNNQAATPAWSFEKQLSSSGGNVYASDAVVDASGNVTVVWYQPGDVVANRFNIGTEWTGPTVLDGETGSVVVMPQLLLDNNGNVHVVWIQNDGTRNNVRANRFGADWLGVKNVSSVVPGLGNVDYQVRLAKDSSGNVTAVWAQYNPAGTVLNVWANRTSATSTAGDWGEPTQIETSDGFAYLGVQLFVDTNKNIVAIWPKYNGAYYDLWANRYDNNTASWGVASRLETLDFDTSNPVAIMDANGDITVAWTQYDGTRYNMWANRITATGTWSSASAVLIENDLGNADIPMLAVDGVGTVTAVWRQSDGESVNIWSNRYSGTNWAGAATKLNAISGFNNLLDLWVDNVGTPAVLCRTNNRVSNVLWAADFR